MAWTLRLDQFEGPLDLLLFLIGKAKIEIKDIFVSHITEQYIEYVNQAPDIDMEDASSFVQMAATLLEIKSRSLLPKPPDPEEEDPQLALVRQLEEYAAFKQIAQDMHAFEQAALRMFEKLPEEYPLPPPVLELTGLTLPGLMEAFARLLARVHEAPAEDTLASARRIMRDEYTVAACMSRIVRRLRHGRVGFYSLFGEEPTREEVVTLFLALLELLRLGRAQVEQDTIYAEIFLSPARPKEGSQDGQQPENA